MSFDDSKIYFIHNNEKLDQKQNLLLEKELYTESYFRELSCYEYTSLFFQ